MLEDSNNPGPMRPAFRKVLIFVVRVGDSVLPGSNETRVKSRTRSTGYRQMSVTGRNGAINFARPYARVAIVTQPMSEVGCIT